MDETSTPKPGILLIEPDDTLMPAYQLGLNGFARNYQLTFQRIWARQLKEDPNMAVVVYGTTPFSRPNLIQLALRDIGLVYRQAKVILLTYNDAQRVRGCDLTLAEGLKPETLTAQIKAIMPQAARRS